MKRILLFLFSIFFFFPLVGYTDPNFPEVVFKEDYGKRVSFDNKKSSLELMALTALQSGVLTGPVALSINALLLAYCWLKGESKPNNHPNSSPQVTDSTLFPEQTPGNDFEDYPHLSFLTDETTRLHYLEKQINHDLDLYQSDKNSVLYQFASERSAAIKNDQRQETIITKQYTIEQKIIENLPHKNDYAVLSGFEIQHVIHKEIIATLTQLHTYSNPHHYFNAPNKVNYEQVQSLSNCARSALDEACGHNQVSSISLAMKMVDVGASITHIVKIMYEYAVLPIAQGTLEAIKDNAQLFLNPIGTTIEMAKVIGRTSVAIARVIIRVDEIDVSELTGDHERSIRLYNDLWQDVYPYMKGFKRAITSASAQDVVKQATRVGVNMLLARKASPAIGMLCDMAEVQAQKLAQLAGTAWQEFQPFMLVDGYIDLSIFEEVFSLLQNGTVKGNQWLKSALEDYPNCVRQYEKLKVAFQMKEFSCFGIKFTKHGVLRLIQRRYTPEEVFEVLNTPTYLKVQVDGARAYVKKIIDNYNIIILNKEGEIVSALKNVKEKDVINMGKNHGWK